uniref:Uncharacterized protein n=1 Tax=Aplanochytrium stocchinoi TaxID=215587 RepID=A0A7S3LJG7_9STRA|mmetsp:Transcript_562/g.668  ORF Transcript_562/g.668 Transcript_562/m.668 type:complete len:130 (-) Transcript_562:629-1018(-)|eukprot:CAMPEP_0204839356 /NCGR_PEP_ID=MMETSP1346-20131115/33956_1 /ASSEMBLY_ACC=CAM_ASM_000771 /TAXON_ID=215587 /ORGANISM="Aplanochytrium stocchinoi, Strain GSBS06" /LENGTH=129 /DNA_ID=CAMNT_0051976013 /DNA_START=92 /DNA_END=481 /DNA_ORIENTATION=+
MNSKKNKNENGDALLDKLDDISETVGDIVGMIREGMKFIELIKSFKSDEEFDAYYISDTYADKSGMLAFMLDEADIVHRVEALKSCNIALQKHTERLRLYTKWQNEISEDLARKAEMNAGRELDKAVEA